MLNKNFGKKMGTKTLVELLMECREELDRQKVPQEGRMLLLDEELVLRPNGVLEMSRSEVARVKWGDRKWHREHPGLLCLRGL